MQINEINVLKENQIDLDWLMDCIDGGHGRVTLDVLSLAVPCSKEQSYHICYIKNISFDPFSYGWEGFQ